MWKLIKMVTQDDQAMLWSSICIKPTNYLYCYSIYVFFFLFTIQIES